MWVAAMPSALVTAMLAAASAGVPALRSSLLIALLVHHLGSRGDWAYLSYLWLCRGRKIYMFDDSDSFRSYFYTARASKDVPASTIEPRAEPGSALTTRGDRS
jgi:hypothetical protein